MSRTRFKYQMVLENNCDGRLRGRPRPSQTDLAVNPRNQEPGYQHTHCNLHDLIFLQYLYSSVICASKVANRLHEKLKRAAIIKTYLSFRIHPPLTQGQWNEFNTVGVHVASKSQTIQIQELRDNRSKAVVRLQPAFRVDVREPSRGSILERSI